MIKVTRYSYDPETTITTVSLSTPQGEITKRVKCSPDDKEKGYLNKAAGKAIATQKCLIEYYHRKTKMFEDRLKGQTMIVDKLLNEYHSTIEWNSEYENTINIVNRMIRNTRKQLEEAKHLYNKSKDDYKDMAALLQAYYYFYGE